jgi:hypothetical protein
VESKTFYPVVCTGLSQLPPVRHADFPGQERSQADPAGASDGSVCHGLISLLDTFEKYSMLRRLLFLDEVA